MKKDHPTFIGIGVRKAGTTWLHSQFNRHSDVYTPVMKELQYFSRSPDKYPQLPSRLGVDSVTERLYGNSEAAKAWQKHFKHFLNINKQNNKVFNFNKHQDFFNCYFGDYSLDRYKSMFQNSGDRISGEITPAYAALDRADIAAIKKFLPDVKIILLLRNPVDRFWSELRAAYSREQIKIADEPVDRLMTKLKWEPFHYPDIVENWRSQFDDDHFFIGFYEEISKAPEALLDRLADFLQLDRSAGWPNASKVVHATAQTRQMPEEVERILIRKYLD